MNLNIQELIPQKRTMCLIDTLSNHGEGFIECQVHIKPETLFSNGEYVPSWVGVEYMAQTVAAYAGLQRKKENLKPSIGLLIGLRNYQTETHRFEFGTTLTIRAVEEYQDQEIGVYACSLLTNNVTVATATLKGFMGNRPFKGLNKD